MARLLLVTLLATALVPVTATPAPAVEIRCDATLPIGAGGSNMSYALGSDGTLWDWGDNYFGQLGNGQNRTRSLTPVHIASMESVTSVAAGNHHVLVLKSDGTVWATGYNAAGQLGDGTTEERKEFFQIPGLDAVSQVFTGAEHSFAVKEDGTVWAWGRNDYGQLGLGHTDPVYVPTQNPSLTGVTAIAGGGRFSLALRTDGKVLSFGNNGGAGELGRGALYTTYPDPDFVLTSSGSHFTNVTAISSSTTLGSAHSMALRSDGTAWTWGYGAYGQLGNGAYDDQPRPVKVKDSSGSGSLSGVTAVSAGAYFSLARTSDATLWAWGSNTYEELGNTSAALYQSLPVEVSGGSSVTAVDAGGNHSIMLKSGGSTHTWGANFNGGIGDGTTTHRSFPYETPIAQSVPNAPTEVDAVAGERLAYLNWTPPTSIVTQYVITPHVNGVAQTAVETQLPGASFAVRSLTEGTTYSFTVAAQNCLGTGTASDHTKRVVPTGVQLDHEGFKVEGTRLTDRMELSVNTFNGDLALVATDLQIAGTGLDLVLSRSWHSRSTESSIFGNGWTSTVGDDIYLEFLADDSVMLHGPGGGTAGFAYDGGTYETPAGVDATLTFDDKGTTDTGDDAYLLEAFTGAERLVFDAATGKLTRQEDRNGNSLTYTYGGPGDALSSITDTQSRSLSFAYNGSGLVKTVTDPLGREVRYTYDGSGNLTAYEDAAGKLTTFTYTSNDLTSITTPAGRQVDLTYDDADRVKTIAWPLAAGTPTTSFTYEFEKTVVTDANGHPTTYHYDPVGRTTGVVDALGNTTSMEYTSHSNVRRYTPGGGGTATFGYSSVHALTSAAAPTGSEHTLRYDDPDHPHLPTTARDPQGNELTYTYDDEGNLIRMVTDLESENRVDVTYDPKGRPTSSTDPRGNPTTYTYDAQGNLTGAAPPNPLGPVGPIVYDAVSRVVSVTDGAGKTRKFAYDPLDRLTRVTYDDGSTVERVYDDDGNLLSETDALGAATMTYDARGRLASRRTPDGVTVAYTYDGVGNLTSVTDPLGTVTYGYNAVNLATSVRLPDGKTVSISYDASYNRTSVRFPDGVAQNFTYDESNRVTRVAMVEDSTTLERFDYGYADPSTGNTDSGLRFTVTDLEGEETVYTYDALNRLEKARTTTASGELVVEYAYRYDGAGNRLRITTTRPGPLGPRSIFHPATYNAANQLVEISGETYHYDGAGNTTGTSLGAEFTYDAAGRTTAIRPRTDRGVPLRFVYRGSGQAERVAAGPVAEHLTTGGPVCTPSGGCHDDPNAVVGTSTYLHTTLGLSGEERAGMRVSYVRDPGGRLLAQRAGGRTQYLLADGLGSVVRVNDHTLGAVATYRYDPFGNPTRATGDSEITPFRYAGYYLDATGLYKTGERYYDPALGRFTQQDPLHDPFDPKLWNRYVYVGNDPVNFTDPTGRGWWEVAKCVGAELGSSIKDFIDGWASMRQGGEVPTSQVGWGAALMGAGALLWTRVPHALAPLAGDLSLIGGAVLVTHAIAEKAGTCSAR